MWQTLASGPLARLSSAPKTVNYREHSNTKAFQRQRLPHEMRQVVVETRARVRPQQVQMSPVTATAQPASVSPSKGRTHVTSSNIVTLRDQRSVGSPAPCASPGSCMAVRRPPPAARRPTPSCPQARAPGPPLRPTRSRRACSSGPAHPLQVGLAQPRPPAAAPARTSTPWHPAGRQVERADPGQPRNLLARVVCGGPTPRCGASSAPRLRQLDVTCSPLCSHVARTRHLCLPFPRIWTAA